MQHCNQIQLTNPDNILYILPVVPIVTKWSNSRAPSHGLRVSFFFFFTISVGFKHSITADPVHSLPAGQTATSCHSQWTIGSAAAQR